MAISFLVPLAIAIIAAFVGYQSQEEIVKAFAIIIMAISLLLGFAWAPWLMQLLILTASLAGMRYFCYRHACQNSLKNK